MNITFIVGCGDIGQRIARLCQENNQTVYGLARSNENASRLRALNILPILGDLDQPASLKGISDVCNIDTVIYYLAPPPTEGTTDPRMANFLSVIDSDNLPAKFILISTTAVYGDCQGKWITEEQPANPQTDRGLRRLDAENTLRSWSEKTGVPNVVLRVGGIYGPGRFPIERLKKSLPILREEESPYTNRIHQDDLAKICVTAAERGKNGEVYNVADGKPSTMSYYFKAVAKANGIPLPPEVTQAEAEKVMTAGMLSYLKESRRLDNKKLIKDLGITLRYADLEAGLKP